MSFATKRAILIKWIEIATGYPVGKVVWADQNMPRPEKPYIIARMSAFKSINREFIHPTDEVGKSDISTHKEFTLGIQCFTTDNIDPIPIMLDLQDSLNKPKFMEMFNPEGLVFVETLMGPTDTTVKLDTTYERRASMDLRMRMPWVVTDSEQGLIELVSGNGIAQIDETKIADIPIDVGEAFAPVELNLDDCELLEIDSLNERLRVEDSGDVIYNMKYNELTIVTINTVPSTIQLLLPGDILDMVYFEYGGEHTLKSVSATRT